MFIIIWFIFQEEEEDKENQRQKKDEQYEITHLLFNPNNEDNTFAMKKTKETESPSNKQTEICIYYRE